MLPLPQEPVGCPLPPRDTGATVASSLSHPAAEERAMWCHPLHGNRWAHPAYFQGMSMFLRCPRRPGLRAGGEGSQELQGCGQLCPGTWAT